MNDTVLVISGLDPTGGAGIAADIETINQFGLTPLPLVTALTIQNTDSVKAVNEVDSDTLFAQFEHLHSDVDITSVKIGMLCSESQVEIVKKILKNIDDKFVVLDPIINSSTNDSLFDSSAVNKLRNELLPLVDLITPNVAELKDLAPNLNELDAIKTLPCKYVLLTTTDTSVDEVEHRLYIDKKLSDSFVYNKLPGNYHGSGCTLASSISALVTSGVDVSVACKRALDYTYQSLLNAKTIGKMQFNPNRQQA